MVACEDHRISLSSSFEGGSRSELANPGDISWPANENQAGLDRHLTFW